MALVRTCVDWKALRPASSAQARLRCLTGPEEWELTVLMVLSCDIVQYKLSFEAEYEQFEFASTVNRNADRQSTPDT
jgi:hypothetical protein